MQEENVLKETERTWSWLQESNGPGFKQSKIQFIPKGLVGITISQCRPEAINKMDKFLLYFNI